MKGEKPPEINMSQVIHDTPNEFWRPPAVPEPTPVVTKIPATRVDACGRCSTEFMVGARFCYRCGTARPEQTAVSWTRHLEFQNIKQALGLPFASLTAFLIGLGCLLAAVFVGVVYSVQNFGDFQAIQFWRMQWLLAAIASFVAAILLKRTGAVPK